MNQQSTLTEAAIQSCQLKTDEAGVTLDIDCPGDIIVEMNVTLLKQMLVKLLINGITYSNKGDWLWHCKETSATAVRAFLPKQ